MLYICAISLYYCVRARVCFQDSVFSGHETHKRVTNTQATFIKGVKMIRFSQQESLTVSLHGVSLSFLTFFPILCPRGGERHIRCSMQSTLSCTHEFSQACQLNPEANLTVQPATLAVFTNDAFKGNRQTAPHLKYSISLTYFSPN